VTLSRLQFRTGKPGPDVRYMVQRLSARLIPSNISWSTSPRFARRDWPFALYCFPSVTVHSWHIRSYSWGTKSVEVGFLYALDLLQ
jgi:hypothetical protein